MLLWSSSFNLHIPPNPSIILIGTQGCNEKITPTLSAFQFIVYSRPLFLIFLIINLHFPLFSTLSTISIIFLLQLFAVTLVRVSLVLPIFLPLKGNAVLELPDFLIPHHVRGLVQIIICLLPILHEVGGSWLVLGEYLFSLVPLPILLDDLHVGLEKSQCVV